MQPDPVAALRQAFCRIAATRMAGLALLNPALQVATIGFSPWQAVQVGVLVTPWAINLVVVSDDPDALWLATDRHQRWHFPDGDYDMMGAQEAECGAFQFCSLFSPVLEFVDQTMAEATAQAIMDALLAPPRAPSSESRRAFLRRLTPLLKT